MQKVSSPMTNNKKRTADGILITKNVVAGLFPVLTVIAYANSLPPFAALAWGSLIAAILSFCVVMFRGELMQNILNSREVIIDIILAIFIIAIVVYGL